MATVLDSPASQIAGPGNIVVSALTSRFMVLLATGSLDTAYILPAASVILNTYGVQFGTTQCKVNPGDVWERVVINMRNTSCTIMPGDGGSNGALCASNDVAQSTSFFYIQWLTITGDSVNGFNGTYNVIGSTPLSVTQTVTKVAQPSSPVSDKKPVAPEPTSFTLSMSDDYYVVPSDQKDFKS
jgi:hypothetical protein